MTTQETDVLDDEVKDLFATIVSKPREKRKEAVETLYEIAAEDPEELAARIAKQVGSADSATYLPLFNALGIAREKLEEEDEASTIPARENLASLMSGLARNQPMTAILNQLTCGDEDFMADALNGIIRLDRVQGFKGGIVSQTFTAVARMADTYLEDERRDPASRDFGLINGAWALGKLVQAFPDHPTVPGDALRLALRLLGRENERIRHNAARLITHIARQCPVCPEAVDEAVPMLLSSLGNIERPLEVKSAIKALLAIFGKRPIEDDVVVRFAWRLAELTTPQPTPDPAMITDERRTVPDVPTAAWNLLELKKVQLYGEVAASALHDIAERHRKALVRMETFWEGLEIAPETIHSVLMSLLVIADVGAPEVETAAIRSARTVLQRIHDAPGGHFPLEFSQQVFRLSQRPDKPQAFMTEIKRILEIEEHIWEKGLREMLPSPPSPFDERPRPAAQAEAADRHAPIQETARTWEQAIRAYLEQDVIGSELQRHLGLSEFTAIALIEKMSDPETGTLAASILRDTYTPELVGRLDHEAAARIAKGIIQALLRTQNDLTINLSREFVYRFKTDLEQSGRQAIWKEAYDLAEQAISSPGSEVHERTLEMLSQFSRGVAEDKVTEVSVVTSLPTKLLDLAGDFLTKKV